MKKFFFHPIDLFARLVFAIPKTFLSIVVFTVVITSFLAAKIPFDFSTESLFVSKDPHRITFERFKKNFGQDDKFIFIAFSHEFLFSPKTLRKIQIIQKEIRKISLVEDSLSIVDVIAAEDLLFRFQLEVKKWEKQLRFFGLQKGEGQAFLLMAKKVGIRPIIQQLQKAREKAEVLKDAARIRILKKRILQNPLYIQNIISKDGKTTGILVLLSRKVTNNEKRTILFGKIEEILSHEKGFHFYLAGMPVVRAEYARLISRDHLTFLPIIIPLTFIILFWIFRSPFQILVPPLAIGASVIWTIGIMSAMGESINIISNVIYILLFVIGIATSIHVLAYFNDQLVQGASKKDGIHATITHMGRACFFTTFTTSIGFLSLIVTDIQIIRQFGLYSALGVMLTFVGATVVIPLFLYFLPAEKKVVHHPRMKNFLSFLARINLKHPFLVLFLVALMFLAAYGGIRYLVIDTHMLEEIHDSNPVVIANHFVEKKLTGVLPLEILLREKEKGLFLRPSEYIHLDKLEGMIARQDWIVSKVISMTDVLKVANMVINGYHPKFFRIPKNKELIATLYKLEDILSQEEKGVFRFTSENHSLFRISIRLKDKGTKAHFQLVSKIRQYFKNHPELSKKYSIIFTGETHMAAIVIQRLIHSMLSSIFMAAGIIFVVMIFLFRSFKISILSVIPNVLPIVFTLGAMGLLGIILRTSTVVIFSISLGIAVDDTIHYLLRYRHFLKEGMDKEKALKTTLQTTGQAMIWTTLVLCSGLLVLTTSHFKATVDFGILGTVTLFSALIGDLILLPVLVLLFTQKKDFEIPWRKSQKVKSEQVQKNLEGE